MNNGQKSVEWTGSHSARCGGSGGGSGHDRAADANGPVGQEGRANSSNGSGGESFGAGIVKRAEESRAYLSGPVVGPEGHINAERQGLVTSPASVLNLLPKLLVAGRSSAPLDALLFSTVLYAIFHFTPRLRICAHSWCKRREAALSGTSMHIFDNDQSVSCRYLCPMFGGFGEITASWYRQKMSRR